MKADWREVARERGSGGDETPRERSIFACVDFALGFVVKKIRSLGFLELCSSFVSVPVTSKLKRVI